MGSQRNDGIESVGAALRRIAVTRVLLPLLVFGAVRLFGPMVGLTAEAARTWSWVAGAIAVLVVFSMGDGNALGRAGRHDDPTLRLAGRWNGRDFGV